MKKTLLSLFAFLLGFSAIAQEFPYTVQLYDDAVFYGMYVGLVDEPVPAGLIRHSNSSYATKLTQEQLDSFGNTLTMTVTMKPLCDNYDRIGNVNLALVPAGQDTYTYNDPLVKRIEIGRFITPFMDMHVDDPGEVPYTFEIDNVTQIFHDPAIVAEYDIWIELEMFGHQGGPGQGGAAVEIPGCADRIDVYMGSLEFVSGYNPQLELGANHLVPLAAKYELKNYTLDGTDELGETVKTITFTLDNDVPNAKLYLITSNHGAQEEFIRRWHFVDFDGEEVLEYRPGGVSCVPYSYYNTQPNCIYINCVTGVPRPDTNSAWSWNNWCPGNKIPTRVIELGDLEAGEHTFKIEVPSAQFLDGEGNPGNGYFPMSVYLQGYEETLGSEDFDTAAFNIFPNPVTDIVTINASGPVRAIKVTNMLGQVVMTSDKTEVDMSQLQNGVYMVEIQLDNNKTAVKRVVKK